MIADNMFISLSDDLLCDSEAARAEAWAAGADELIAQAEVTGRLRKLIRDLATGRTPRKTDTPTRAKKRSSTKEGPERA